MQQSGRCFRHLNANPIYGHHMVMMLLVVHLIIGHRRLRDVDSYRDDEMVKRILGLKRLPDVSTVSRSLASAGAQSVAKVRSESRHLVMECLAHEGFSRVTLDYDGSVLSTGRHAEGTAVGFNKKKGARSYYPLFCTVAQTGQVLDVHHRPGNVHDSDGADAFIDQCMSHVRSCLPRATVETRIDSAFFNEAIAERLHGSGVEFTISVPFERFAALKGLVEGRRRWRRMAVGLDYFETRWKPKSWNTRHRFYRGFNLFLGDDHRLFLTLARGEWCISGFRAADLRAHLPRLTPSRCSSLLKRLRTHGLIKKVGHRYKYYLTRMGRRILVTALNLRESMVLPSLCEAGA